MPCLPWLYIEEWRLYAHNMRFVQVSILLELWTGVGEPPLHSLLLLVLLQNLHLHLFHQWVLETDLQSHIAIDNSLSCNCRFLIPVHYFNERHLLLVSTLLLNHFFRLHSDPFHLLFRGLAYRRCNALSRSPHPCYNRKKHASNLENITICITSLALPTANLSIHSLSAITVFHANSWRHQLIFASFDNIPHERIFRIGAIHS